MINKTVSTIGLIFTAGVMSLLAQNGTWSTDASGNWSDTSKWLSGVVANGTGNTADFSTINITADRTVTLDAAHTLSTLKFGDAGVTDHNWTLSGANTLTLGTTPTINVVNQTATISSLIAGTAFTKLGAGTLVLNGSAVNTFTGTMAVKAGTLTEDFSNLGTPANLVASSVVLSLAGGTLSINGAASGATSQAFASTTFNTGGNAINVVNNGTSATLTLGAITYSGVCPVQYSSTGTITTTTAGGGPLGLMWVNYSTFGTSDWASTSLTGGGVGTSPYTIKGLGSVTGGYVTTMGGTGQNQNMDLQANYTAGGNVGTTTLRFNTPAAYNVNVNNKWVIPNAVLVTPNMGAVNASISGGNWFAVYNQVAATEWVVQNNTAGYFINTGGLINDRGSAGALTYVQSGPGTTVQPGLTTAAGGVNPNSYTGQSYLNGGQTVAKVDADLGAPATGAQVNLNGGTVVGNATFTMDNGGANKRAFVLGTAGGGLAATAGNTMTIDGIVSSATAGVGALTIGIPASSANGSTQGLLPGSGSGTANTTSVMATGTVALSGANTYSGGTIIQNAVLNFANGALGTGGITINGGTLQWNANTTDISAQTVTIGTAGATFDVNGNSVSLANSLGNGGSGALTVYSTTGTGSLTLLVGNNYSGGTAVTNGTLVVNNTSGSGTGSGTVTVANNGALGGTGIIGGAVTINSGGIIAPGTTSSGNGTIGSLTVGSLTMGSGSVYSFAFNATPTNDTIVVTNSGGLTVNGGVFNLYLAGGSTGWSAPSGITTYNLIQYAGSIGGAGLDSTWTTDSPSNPHVANPKPGYSYYFGSTGTYLTVTITQVGTLGSWGVNASGNWTVAGNWLSGNVPGANTGISGDTATFAGVTTTSNLIVNLNANESVGAVTMNQAPSFSISNAVNTLTLDNKGVGAVVTVSAGTSNAIQTAVSLNDNATVTVSSGNSLTISGTISNAPSVSKTLTVNGAGTTIISGANSYGPAAGAVGTTLSGGGILQVANAGALGAGDVTNTGNSTLQAGAAVSLANNVGIGSAVTITVDNNGNSFALNGVVSGSGTLKKISAGTLTLTGNNTLSGGLAVNAGTLSISSATNVGTSAIILNGGDLLGTASFYAPNSIGVGSASGATPGTALIDAATGQTFELDGNITTAGNTGANNLTVNSLAANPGTVVLGGNNTFTGTTVIYTNTLVLNNPLALQNSTLNYSSGTLAFSGITTATLGSLSSIVTPSNLVLTNAAGAAVTLTVGNNNGTASYAGVISGGGALTKVGSGSQTIGVGAGGGANYSGKTTVNSGTLILGGVGSMTSAGNLTISGTGGSPASLILADSASISVGGMVQVLYDGGAGFPAVCSLLVTNSASLTGDSLSYGNGSRVVSSSVTVAGSGLLSITNAFDLIANIGSTPQTDLANLNGGTLAVGKILDSAAGATHQAQINFNGGVLKANASDPISGPTTTFLPAFTGLTVYVNAGAGALINPNGYAITIASAITHGNGTPDGGLTVFGGGMLTLTASNSYTGVTTVSNVVLSVNNTTGSGTGNNAVNVLTNGYLGGSGTIYGTVTVANYGHTFPGGTNGNVTGVTTTVSNLTYNTGAEADFNLSSTYNSGNDELVVKGALNGNGVSIGINPTDVNTNMDATGDYVLLHVTGSYVSGFNPIPVWRGATPTNAAYYSVVYNGSDVVLHYSAITLLSASVTPNPANRNQVVTFTVNATAVPGIDPAVGIYVNAAPIGGSSPLYLKYAGGNSYTNSTTVMNGFLTTGVTNLSYTVTDLSSDTSSGVIPLSINSTTEVWDGLGLDNQLVTGTNWVSNLSPAYGDAVTFAGTTQTTPNMESSYTLSSVTFTNGAGAFDITNSANTLTLMSGGGVTNLSINGQTLDVPVTLIGKPTFNAAAGNLALNYPVADDGNGVIFAGANTTTLAGVNTYTGNTTISAGTLQINGAGQLNAGTYVGNITNNGSFVYNSSATQTLSGGIISGTGSLTLQGSGTLTLGAKTGATATATTYTGATVVNGGILALNAGNYGNSGLYLSSGLTINNGGTVQVVIDNSLAGSTSPIGSCPVTINAGGLLTGLSTADGGSGPSSHIRGLLTLNGGTLAIAGTGTGANSLKFGSWDLDDGVVVNGGTNTSTISAVSVMLTQTGGTIFNVANGSTPSGIDLNVVVPLIATSGGSGAPTITPLVKTGNGTMVLSAANTYPSATTISNGTLRVDGSLAAGSAVTVVGGTLSGVGTINGATAVNAGAYLMAGDAGIGTLTFNNSLTLNASSTNRFVVTTAGGASNTVAVTAGTLTPNSSVIKINTAGSATLGAGTNVLFTYSAISGSFSATPVFDTVQTGAATNAFIYNTGSQIQLVVTNLSSVSLNPTNITATVTGSTLSLTWPADHLGWTLQTNAVDLANTNYWFAYPGSATVTNVNITINPAQTNVFFRMVYP